MKFTSEDVSSTWGGLNRGNGGAPTEALMGRALFSAREPNE